MSQRHHLIYLYPDAEFSIISSHPNNKIIKEQAKLWIEQGFPCIYAKQLVGQDSMNLGITLGHEHKKHRVGLQVAPVFIQKQMPPPQLVAMQQFFLSEYKIEDLKCFIERLPVARIEVYGSFLFHYLSGYSFVNSASDLDLLIHYYDYSLTDLQDSISALADKFKRTIDGEIRFPKYGDIPIKELMDKSAKKLLCKGKDQVNLLSKAELYEHYSLL